MHFSNLGWRCDVAMTTVVLVKKVTSEMYSIKSFFLAKIFLDLSTSFLDVICTGMVLEFIWDIKRYFNKFQLNHTDDNTK